MELTKDIIAKIVAESREPGGTCIECGGQYFHAKLCTRGVGMEPAELVAKLTARALRYDNDKSKDKAVNCYYCHAKATGTLWEAYHNYLAVISAKPCCEECTITQINDKVGRSRPRGYIPDVITKDPTAVAKLLSGILKISVI